MYSSVTQREQFCKATFSSDHSSDGDISLNFKFVTVLTPALLERAILTDDLIESAIFEEFSDQKWIPPVNRRFIIWTRQPVRKT